MGAAFLARVRACSAASLMTSMGSFFLVSPSLETRLLDRMRSSLFERDMARAPLLFTEDFSPEALRGVLVGEGSARGGSPISAAAGDSGRGELIASRLAIEIAQLLRLDRCGPHNFFVRS